MSHNLHNQKKEFVVGCGDGSWLDLFLDQFSFGKLVPKKEIVKEKDDKRIITFRLSFSFTTNPREEKKYENDFDFRSFLFLPGGLVPSCTSSLQERK